MLTSDGRSRHMIENPLSLEGKRLLMTGASSGIGRATSELCSRLGARLICLGRDQQRLNDTLASLAGEQHSSRVADADDAEALPRLVQGIVEESGPLAGIVHSAGIQRVAPLRIAKADDFLAQYRTNALAAAQLLAAVARRGVASPDGCSVVLVGSVMSVRGAAGLASYCSSKAALLGLVRAAAIELASARIRVNAVLPGVVHTEMSRRYLASLADDQVRAIEQSHPLGLGKPEDVAQAIAFLLADASRWITGTSLTVDGGYSAQ
jgi:NAD(P)-dependent dehydrogenase (short-subunit alcohol dehydrogenase family)